MMLTMVNDYYKRLQEVVARGYNAALYYELYRILRQVCDECCDGKAFSNFFSLLGYVCQSRCVDTHMAALLQNLRRRASDVENADEELFRYDAKLVAKLVAHISGRKIPASLLHLLPIEDECKRERRMAVVEHQKMLRVRVQDWDKKYIYVQKDIANDDGETVLVAYTDEDAGGELGYITKIIHKDCTLNLLEVSVDKDHIHKPKWIIYEPDFLVSPSELAAAFELHGALPINYLLRELETRKSTYYTLLGNTCGEFLDSLVRQRDNDKASYAKSLKRAFERDPLDFSLLMRDAGIRKRFHAEAQQQFINIKRTVEQELCAVYDFDLSKILVEPSLVCPAVGLAGRMDLLQSDATKLIEQKSGKRDEWHNTHKEPHFVQVMLYQLMIEYAMGKKSNECDAYLLYSRYANAMMSEHPYIKLLKQAVEMRNEVVSLVERIGHGDAVGIFDSVDVDSFRISEISDRLWLEYLRPRIVRQLEPFMRKGDVSVEERERNEDAKSFFYRFYEFLMKEQWLGRMGVPGDMGHGYADLWNSPALVRQENGDMYSCLKVKTYRINEDGVNVVLFTIPEMQLGLQPNFRSGDAVQIYCYEGGEPAVYNQVVMRARLSRLETDELEVVLNNAQHDVNLFNNLNNRFALEHDRVEAGNSVMCAGLYAFLNGPDDVKDSFLLRVLPEKGDEQELIGDYGQFNEVVIKERAAKDMFLVIGPPGSGKTSCAIRYMLEEELRCSEQSRILLMAYTNRAVDELCGMLEGVMQQEPDLLNDYLRLGHELSAQEKYRHRMLSCRVGEEVSTAADVEALLSRIRVVVATTSMMSRQQLLLERMRFDVAFVDEASQILEPYLLPVITTKAVGKWVLIGDQKQLPAVVQQDAESSVINVERLKKLGFVDCANSMFCRMLHRVMDYKREDLYCMLKVQGRMHPDVLKFANEEFYNGQLRCVPLEHQQRSMSEEFAVLPKGANALEKLLARRRVVFLDCKPVDDGVNDKINSCEAAMVVKCLTAIKRIYMANGRELMGDDIGIIVPYRNQISTIRKKLVEQGLDDFKNITIDTVERYQGSQRDIIIYSFTVRHLQQLRFLTSASYVENDGQISCTDIDNIDDCVRENICATDKNIDANNSSGAYVVDRKLNVVLTRARQQTILVGNEKLLRENAIFSRLINIVDKVKKGC